MRNRTSQKVITSLLAATVAGFMALSIMPELRCSSDRCIFAPGFKCFAGGKIHNDYKMRIGFDG